MPNSLRAIVQSYDPGLPLAQATTPPSAWYTDARIAELEQTAVFARTWQFAGRAPQVRHPGQYITTEIAGEPVLIVRDRERRLRGFFNVCRHHAAALLDLPEGCAEQLRCPYHGWTYALSGELIQTPEFAAVEGFDRAAHGLVPIEIGELHGWLFARIAPGAEHLGNSLDADLLGTLGDLSIERLQWCERRSYTLPCNWKVFVDNYLDGGYHVPHLHKELNGVLSAGKYRITTGARHCLQTSEMNNAGAQATIGTVRQGQNAFYLWIYPNLMINRYQDVMDTNLVRPLGAERCEVIFDYYFDDVSTDAQNRNRASIEVSEAIQEEDRVICKSVQRGLRSRAYDTGRLSVRREAGAHLFHKLLHADLVAGLREG